MPLLNDVQLIVRVEDGNAGRRCVAFSGLALPNPVLIQFSHVGSSQAQAAMDALADALIVELQTGVHAVSLTPPCPVPVTRCHAVDQPDCNKLLVLVGDDHTVAPLGAPPLVDWLGRGPDFAVLPILPQTAQTRTAMLLPPPLNAINAVFWDGSVEEALPALFQVGGVTAAPRIFISYRQSDTATAAIQLFDALSHDGFDVFLDHFWIAPGVDFQARLRQELGDKAMVLLLESTNLASSPWVALEIAEAKACGLGLIALNFAGAPAQPGVDPRLRHWLARTQWKADGTIIDPALQTIRGFVRREHDRAILRRRVALEQSFEQAVLRAGGSSPDRHPDGSFGVAGAGRHYLAWLSPRPPELTDYHRAHGATHPPSRGVMIGLSQLLEAPRQRQQAWLAGLCNMTLVDEGLLVQAATQMVRGAL